MAVVIDLGARWIAMVFLGGLVLAFGMAFAATSRFPREAAQIGVITREVSQTRVGTVRKRTVRGRGGSSYTAGLS